MTSMDFVYRLSLNVLTLTIESRDVYTQLGVAISVTGISQVTSTQGSAALYLVSSFHTFIEHAELCISK